jgi:uncharacterized membrane protein
MLNVSGSNVLVSADEPGHGDSAPRTGSSAFPYWLLPVIAAWGYGAWLYGRLPAQVPVHWDFSGQVDRYGGPVEAAFLLPGIMTLTAALLAGLLPLFIPRTPDYAGTQRTYGQLVALVMGFLLYMEVVIAQLFLGHQDVPLIGLMVLGAGVLFVLMGNVLPKLKRNWIAGARLPWVMHDDVAWVRAQRAAGLGFVVFGIVLICASPLQGWLPLYVMLAGKALVVGVVVWYSLRTSRRQ